MNEVMNLVITDGGNREGTYGSYMIYDPSGKLVAKNEYFWGVGDHNQAEYWILLEAVNFALQNGIRCVIIFTDSETVATQLNLSRPLHSDRLKRIRNSILETLKKFDFWEIRCVDRSLMKTFLGH